MLSKLIIVFIPRSKVSFNFMAAVTICSDFGAPKNKVSVCTASPSICHEAVGADARILVFECWVLSQLFHSPLSLSSRGSSGWNFFRTSPECSFSSSITTASQVPSVLFLSRGFRVFLCWCYEVSWCRRWNILYSKQRVFPTRTQVPRLLGIALRYSTDNLLFCIFVSEAAVICQISWVCSFMALAAVFSISFSLCAAFPVISLTMSHSFYQIF